MMNTPHPPSILTQIVTHKHEEVAARKASRSLSALEKTVTPLTGFPFEAALANATETSPKLILEIKPASPSAGVLQEDLDLSKVLSIYNAYANAISVLTDSKYFGGSLKLLEDVSTLSPHPTLCKDFILEPYQVFEAREAGASAILLIVKILADNTLATLHQTALDLGLTPVVEIQNEAELTRALAFSPKVLLINNRNLETFEINFETTERLVALIPKNIQVISASGIEGPQDVTQLLPHAQRFLIGSTLMRNLDRAEKRLNALFHLNG